MALRHETTFGQLDAGDARAVRFYRNTAAETEAIESDEVLGTPQTNQRDQTEFQDGLPVTAGELEIPICANEIGDHLTMLFGLPTTIADPVDNAYYRHTWASGADILPTAQLEQERKPGDRQVGTGFAWNTL
ncbi:MAG: hypothetical protein AAFY47_12280, partial [Pseudomonadota bacterium]